MSPTVSSSPSPAPRPALRRGWLFAGGIGWALLALVGFRALTRYELTAGTAPHPAAQWPEATGLRLDPRRLNLVLFAHPQCPCTEATIAELTAILTRCPERFSPTVCFFAPADEPAGWTTNTALWRDVQKIPGVRVVADREGRIADGFGALTSGHAFVFDGRGRRLFSGGITGARGHEGANEGERLVIACAHGEQRAPAQTPIFGCALREAGAMKGAP